PARVEAGRRRQQLEPPHVLGQQRVQRVQQPGRLPGAAELEGGDLPERVDARVGTPGAGDLHFRAARQPRERSLQHALDGARLALPLPALEVGAVVGEREAVDQRREPGFSGLPPCAHSGQACGEYVSTASVRRLARGTPSSAAPPLRSTKLPAASTRPPRLRTASITSRVEPPVVMTSSTTTTGSPASITNPRRSAIPPSWRSLKSARQPSPRATSCDTMTPPIAGATTAAGRSFSKSASSRTASSAPSRVASAGSINTRAHCRYWRECSPEVSRKWPSSRAPRSRNSCNSSGASDMPALSRAFRVSLYSLCVTPLTGLIIAKDEEQHLPDCLESVAFCDEVLVIDSGSTDRTRELAAAAGARVLLRAPWPGFAAQRNKGFE